jgi:hypothetical protein
LAAFSVLTHCVHSQSSGRAPKRIKASNEPKSKSKATATQAKQLSIAAADSVHEPKQSQIATKLKSKGRTQTSPSVTAPPQTEHKKSNKKRITFEETRVDQPHVAISAQVKGKKQLKSVKRTCVDPSLAHAVLFKSIIHSHFVQ